MAEHTAPSVPKFASFRPKPTPAPPKETPKEELKKHRPQGDSKRESQEPRRHHHRRHRSGSRERARLPPAKTEQSYVAPEGDLEQETVFIIDRKGDAKNLIYGGVHRYSVPPFYRFGAGHVLGAPSYLKIDREYDEAQSVVLSNWKQKHAGAREKYIFSKVEKRKPRLLKIRPATNNPEIAGQTSDFIPLVDYRGNKRRRSLAGSEEASGSEEDDHNYRSIHGKAKTSSQPADDALQWATDSELSGSESGRVLKIDATTRQKNIELSRKVEKFPKDVDAWLALINNQDAMIQVGQGSHRITNAELRSTSDIKVHMYEQALVHSESLHDRETLLLGMMSEISKFWEIKAQSMKWEQITTQNIDSIKLWTSYLNFKQTAFSTFRYEEIKEIFVARVRRLLEATSLDKGDVSLDSLYSQLIYVLLRLTLFVRESGYPELAIAIWQGLLEMNYFPPNQQLSRDESLGLFGEFWESEVPRIGEDGCRGWRYCTENQTDTDIPDATSDAPIPDLTTSDIFISWTKAERLACNTSTPARTMDEVVEDDPFRVILFSDLKPFLVQLPASSVPLHKSLVNAFLLFCRLTPIEWDAQEEPPDLDLDPFIRDDILESDSQWVKNLYLSDTRVTQDSSDSPIPNMAAKQFALSSETMFGLSIWLRLGEWKNHTLPYTWVRNSIGQLLRAFFQFELAEYYLAFVFQNEPERIKKVTKGLLKLHPTSIRLYNAYAIIEWSRGNKDSARAVFSAALNMSKSQSSEPEPHIEDPIILWKDYVWLCLSEREKTAALQHLLAIPSGIPDTSITPSPALQLKVQQHLSSWRDVMVSFGNFRQAVIYSDCMALLEYLTSTTGKETISSHQGQIDAALKIYESFSQTLITRGQEHTPAHEVLLQSAARLLYHHSSIGPYRPSFIREHLTSFLKFFPQNTIFLSLYDRNESRVRIDNRVRNILQSTILTPNSDCITSRLFAIHHEIKHGTIHSAKAAFEHALSLPVGKSSAGLWKLYLLYCRKTPQFEAQAEDVWYRALRACPWAKELYLVGFEELNDIIGLGEMKRTWRIMGEKDLRVHVDLEDAFEEIEELEKKNVRSKVVHR